MAIIVESPVEHDGVRYEIHATIPGGLITDEQAAALVAAGAGRIAPEPKPVKKHKAAE